MDQLDDLAHYRNRASHLEPCHSSLCPLLSVGPYSGEFMSFHRDLVDAAKAATAPINERLLHPEIASLFYISTYHGTWMLLLAGEPRKDFTIILVERSASDSPHEPWTVGARIVTTRQAPLKRELAEAVCEIWKKVLYATRYPKGPPLAVNDGDIYFFHYWSEYTRTMAGETASPPATTAPGKLAALSHTMKEYVLGDSQSKLQIVQKLEEQVAAFPTEVE